MSIKEISIERALKRLLITQKGSRVMNPNYGMDYTKYVDKNFDDSLKVDLIADIYNLVSEYETRVEIDKIDVRKKENVFEFVINETVTV